MRSRCLERSGKRPSSGWLLSTDNQLRQFGSPGWRHLVLGDDLASRGHPSTWPSWAICPDQGLDSTAGINYLLREVKANLDPTFCASHGAHNDTKLALKHSQLWPRQLLMVLAWRAWRGPWGTDDRFEQVKEVVEANFASLDRTTDPLFHAL